MDAEQEDELVGREPSDLEDAEVHAWTMVEETETRSVPFAVAATVGAEHEMVVLEMLPRHAARDSAPVAVAGDDLAPAVDFTGFGGVVRLDEVDEDDLEDTPGGGEGVFQGQAAALERAIREIEGILGEPEANAGHAVLGMGEGEVCGEADDAGEAAVEGGRQSAAERGWDGIRSKRIRLGPFAVPHRLRKHI